MFLIGIFFNSALFGLVVALGESVSTATAILLGADKALVRAGMFQGSFFLAPTIE